VITAKLQNDVESIGLDGDQQDFSFYFRFVLSLAGKVPT
jgi:hypothetical protein